MDMMAGKIEAALLEAVRMGPVEEGLQYYSIILGFIASVVVVIIAAWLVL